MVSSVLSERLPTVLVSGQAQSLPRPADVATPTDSHSSVLLLLHFHPLLHSRGVSPRLLGLRFRELLNGPRQCNHLLLEEPVASASVVSTCVGRIIQVHLRHDAIPVLQQKALSSSRNLLRGRLFGIAASAPPGNRLDEEEPIPGRKP